MCSWIVYFQSCRDFFCQFFVCDCLYFYRGVRLSPYQIFLFLCGRIDNWKPSNLFIQTQTSRRVTSGLSFLTSCAKMKSFIICLLWPLSKVCSTFHQTWSIFPQWPPTSFSTKLMGREENWVFFFRKSSDLSLMKLVKLLWIAFVTFPLKSLEWNDN